MCYVNLLTIRAFQLKFAASISMSCVYRKKVYSSCVAFKDTCVHEHMEWF